MTSVIEALFVSGGSHLAESRLADRSYGRQSFGRLVVWPTGRMADRSFGRHVTFLERIKAQDE
ncbi:hypothetical protein M514_00159 [Trichuris suis]|uniref:Uncharacterized protein n=1 Tax=Trichuris suis TaxID=68888 RepID=A0A085NU83_9BILA|nr:hypothetical protein M513_00159 [Trichuris suis]KFD73029.1 hypothetical protein M514_00159 [Trichuris suis]